MWVYEYCKNHFTGLVNGLQEAVRLWTLNCVAAEVSGRSTFVKSGLGNG